jgi:uncharacterized protein (TIGR03435 family)
MRTTMCVLKTVVARLLVLFALAHEWRATAQEPAAGKTFDVASVRENRSGTTQSRTNRTATSVTIVNQTLRPIIQLAFGIPHAGRIFGAPKWATVDRFDIDARGAIGGLDDFRAMMQGLLAERFKLAAHIEQRDMPIYHLVQARPNGALGPSLTRSTTECPAGRGTAPPAAAAPGDARCGLRASGAGEITLVGVNIDVLAAFLSISQQRQVVDRTGLTGRYDIHLAFAPDPLPGRAADPQLEGRPVLVTALQEQLGLKLKAATELQDVLVIDSVSRPDAN